MRPLSVHRGDSTSQLLLLLCRAGFLILHLQIIHHLLHVRHSGGHLLGAVPFVL
jgi:hypothetical protein